MAILMGESDIVPSTWWLIKSRNEDPDTAADIIGLWTGSAANDLRIVSSVGEISDPPLKFGKGWHDGETGVNLTEEQAQVMIMAARHIRPEQWAEYARKQWARFDISPEISILQHVIE